MTTAPIRIGFARAAVVATVLVGVLLGGTLAGCGSAEAPTSTPAAASGTVTPDDASGGATAPEPDQAPTPVAAATPLPKSTPTRVRVPDIGVDSSLMPLGLNPDRTIEVPPLSRSEQAGFYQRGAFPGSVGPAVILGHIDGGGKKGVFYRLQSMKAGQQITVSRADGRDAVFTVTRVERFPKTDFPTQAVYGKTPDAQLRLISCGGALDRQAHSYLDNVIVFATLTSVSTA